MTEFAFDGNGTQLLTIGNEEALWSRFPPTAEPEPKTVLSVHGFQGNFSIGPNRRWLAGITATAKNDTRNQAVRLWDLTSEEPQSSAIDLRGHQGLIQSVDFSASGNWLVTGGEDGTAQVWNLVEQDPGNSAIILRGHTGAVSARFTPDERLVVTTAGASTRLWTMTPDGPIRSAIPSQMSPASEFRPAPSRTVS